MARCKVCHRQLTNPAHIAAGMGPVCAAKAAARASVSDATTAQRGYPVAKYQRIVRAAEILAAEVGRASRYLEWARREGTTEERAEAQQKYRMANHWYERAKRMEQRAYRLLAPVVMRAA